MGKLFKVRMIFAASLFIAVLTIGIYYIFHLHPPTNQIIHPILKQKKKGCLHPKLYVNDKMMIGLMPKDKTISCTDEENWTSTKRGILLFSASAIKTYGQFKCDIVEIKRVDDLKNVQGKILRDVKNGSVIEFELFTIACEAANKKRYDNLHSAFIRKPSIEERIKSSEKVSSELTRPNIVIFGLDSVSRMSWLRKLPKTRDYFINTLDGIELEDYNIVGDGTPAALLPILTSKNEWELPEARRHMHNSQPVDGHPWIWKEFKEFGYLTHWSEDCPGIATFTYRMRGFTHPPTDFYMRPFYIQASKINLEKGFCFHSVKAITTVTDWIRDFMRTFPLTPKFSFSFISEMSHDSYVLDHVDEDLLQLLKYLKESRHLSNTILFFMSDHGARFSVLRKTINGKTEERMPYIGFSFPKAFQDRYPDAIRNFRSNSRKLTTPFDIYETLIDILANNLPRNNPDLSKRAISLFNKIPLQRTCVDADIPPHWCACASVSTMHINSTIIQKAAHGAVAYMNNLLEKIADKCKTIVLSKVHSGKSYEANKDMLNFKKSADDTGKYADLSDKMSPTSLLLELDIETHPGAARYEFTVMHDIKSGQFIFDQAQISRINQYGNAPHCILATDFDLRLFCHCKL